MTDSLTAEASGPSIPPDIKCAQDYERLAPRFLRTPFFEYIAGGSAEGVTTAANRRELGAWTVCPRVLAEVAHGHTRLMLGGDEHLHPILLAPVAHQKLAHPQGELESARAAAATRTCMVVSTLSNYTLEDIAGAGGTGHWFQLYAQPDRAATADLIRRAQAAGYRAIVLTVDAPVQVPSLDAQRAGFQMPAACTTPNLAGYGPVPAHDLARGESRVLHGYMRRAATWRDLEWLRAETPLPLWVKGVLHVDDARALRDAGIAGIVVSNHGGRGLDGAPASLAMLPEVRAAVGDDYPVLFDSGIRSGMDVFKALALGADAVLIGRLQVYALAVAGALGVAHVVTFLREELEICMALSGCATLADIRRATLHR
ncbi:MAG: alpha-hydroxy-acid oxidizing protein [Acidobacteria bacterium]|nr:alpha-hydroxy-acid oxidizing protein [Acidobacteriota bacterium]